MSLIVSARLEFLNWRFIILLGSGGRTEVKFTCTVASGNFPIVLFPKKVFQVLALLNLFSAAISTAVVLRRVLLLWAVL